MSPPAGGIGPTGGDGGGDTPGPGNGRTGGARPATLGGDSIPVDDLTPARSGEGKRSRRARGAPLERGASTVSMLSPEETHQRAKVAAHARWSKPGAREAHGAKIRAARIRAYEARVDPDGALEPSERAKLAENALQADMARLALASARARRKRREAS